jgi:hypothetical protein
MQSSYGPMILANPMKRLETSKSRIGDRSWHPRSAGLPTSLNVCCRISNVDSACPHEIHRPLDPRLRLSLFVEASWLDPRSSYSSACQSRRTPARAIPGVPICFLGTDTSHESIFSARPSNRRLGNLAGCHRFSARLRAGRAKDLPRCPTGRGQMHVGQPRLSLSDSGGVMEGSRLPSRCGHVGTLR